ncbi:MAG: hypothetical protein QXH63_05390, partial [Pyrobaculum sp.]
SAFLALSIFLAWSIFSPLMATVREVDPAWQSIEVGNIYNFREAIYLRRAEVSLSCGGWGTSLVFWFVADREPGELLEISVRNGAVVGRFERTFAEAFGVHIGVAPLYGARRLIVVYTDLKNGVEGPIYGSPVRIDVIEARHIVKSGGVCRLYYGGGVITQVEVDIVEVFNKTALVR